MTASIQESPPASGITVSVGNLQNEFKEAGGPAGVASDESGLVIDFSGLASEPTVESTKEPVHEIGIHHPNYLLGMARAKALREEQQALTASQHGGRLQKGAEDETASRYTHPDMSTGSSFIKWGERFKPVVSLIVLLEGRQ